MIDKELVFCSCCALTQLVWADGEPEPTTCFLCSSHKRGSKTAMVEHEGRLLERINRLEIARRDFEKAIEISRHAFAEIAAAHAHCICLESKPCVSARSAADGAKACADAVAIVPGLRPL